jgi:hypothetical protein
MHYAWQFYDVAATGRRAESRVFPQLAPDHSKRIGEGGAGLGGPGGTVVINGGQAPVRHQRHQREQA